MASAKARTERARDAYAFLVPKMQELRDEGRTCEQIAEWLSEQGHQTTAAKPFNPAIVCRIMQRADGVKPKKWTKLPASLITRMRTMRENGNTLQGVANSLNDGGHTTAAGNPWIANSVHRKLNPRSPKHVAMRCS